MQRARMWWGVVAVASALAGCATTLGVQEFATQSEMQKALGEPVRVWDNGDGTRTFEYSSQPYGTSALMVTVDAQGRVVRQLDALSDDNLAAVQTGMSLDEVARLLGEHRSEQAFGASGEVVRDWNIPNDGPGRETRFNVHFVDGKVVRTSRSYVHPDRIFSGQGAPVPSTMQPPYTYRERWRPRPSTGW